MKLQVKGRGHKTGGAKGVGHRTPLSSQSHQRLMHQVIHTGCDPALLGSRAEPVFFPKDRGLMNVYRGISTLTQSQTKKDSVGLIQQALVDLGFDIGHWGPRKDGVDREYGPDTESGVRAFQNTRSITPTGVMNQDTLKCLDEIRSKRLVPEHQQGAIPASEFQINSAQTGGRDEDLFFDRGSHLLNIETFLKIARLAKAHKGCQLTLEGYQSEDEVRAFGSQLATQRIQQVERSLQLLQHQTPGKCDPADSPARIARPLPNVSSGVSSYRQRRKVEVVPKTARSTTAPCPPGAVRIQPLDALTEKPVLEKSLDQARDFITLALGKLVRGHQDGNDALKAYFGSTRHRRKVRKNLTIWRSHVDGTMRNNHQKGTACLSSCRTAIAFNSGLGSHAMMTLCARYFAGTFSIPQELSNKQKKQAFVVLHEAGHGSIGTEDFGYGHRRLVAFLASQPNLALKNTDSYTRLVFCLSGHQSFCAPRMSANDVIDTTQISRADDQHDVRRGLAWLESWLQWVGQDVSGAYRTLEKSRRNGSWSNTYYQHRVFIPFARVFDLHRPNTRALPTFAEQRYMAAVLDRYLLMRRAASEGVHVSKGSQMQWASGSPGPQKRLVVDSAYLKLTRDRKRVERLLPFIIAATGSIDTNMRAKYEAFTKKDVKRNWDNAPR